MSESVKELKRNCISVGLFDIGIGVSISLLANVGIFVGLVVVGNQYFGWKIYRKIKR